MRKCYSGIIINQPLVLYQFTHTTHEVQLLTSDTYPSRLQKANPFGKIALKCFET